MRTAITRTPGTDPGWLAKSTSATLYYGPVHSSSQGAQSLVVTYPTTTPSPPRPVAVVIHGGTWEAGTPNDTDVPETVAILYAAGFVVFNIDYRQAGTLNAPGGPFALIDTDIADVYLALEWIYANAATYGADKDRILVLGGSAGAHLSAMLAMTGGNGHGRGKVHVCWSVVSKLDDIWNGDADAAWVTSWSTWQESAGSAQDYRKIGPYWFADSKIATYVPYLYLQHEIGDTIDPVAQSRVFDKVLSQAGITHDYKEYPNTPHAFTAISDFWKDMLVHVRPRIGDVRQSVIRTAVSRSVV